MVLPALLTAGAGLIGGFLNKRSNDKANNANAAQNALNIATQNQWRSEDYDRQKEFAQNSAGWQMKDLFDQADASGIHRLSALGASGGAQYQGSTSLTPSTPEQGNDYSFLGDSVGDAMNVMLRAKSAQQAQKLSNSQIEVNKAEAKLLESQSRTALINARAAARGQTGATSETDAPITIDELRTEFERKPGTVTGTNLRTNPNRVDAESWEARYGEVAGEVAGFVNLALDVGEKAGGPVRNRRFADMEQQAKDSALKIKNQRHRRAVLGLVKNKFNELRARQSSGGSTTRETNPGKFRNQAP